LRVVEGSRRKCAEGFTSPLGARGSAYRHRGHVFRGRYGSRLIERESHLLEVFRYVFLNPVRAGICRSPRQYRWSSYRATLGLEPVPGFLTIEPILELFANSQATARKRLVAFVEGP
jgi:putative transposase